MLEKKLNKFIEQLDRDIKDLREQPVRTEMEKMVKNSQAQLIEDIVNDLIEQVLEV